MENVINNRFKRINNCNLIFDSMKNLNLKVESINSIDIVDKKKERYFGILWQLLRYYYIKLNNIECIDDNEDTKILKWAENIDQTTNNININCDEGGNIISNLDREKLFYELFGDLNSNLKYIENLKLENFINLNFKNKEIIYCNKKSKYINSSFKINKNSSIIIFEKK